MLPTSRESNILIATAIIAVALVVTLVFVAWQPPSLAPESAPAGPRSYGDRLQEMQSRERAITIKSMEMTARSIGDGRAPNPSDAARLKKLEGELRAMKDDLRAYLEANPDLPRSAIIEMDDIGRRAEQQFRDIARELDAADGGAHPRRSADIPPSPPAPGVVRKAPTGQFRQVSPQIGGE